MIIKFYKSISEKKSLIESQHNLGKSVIHDDFIDINDNSTDRFSGKLTFELIAQPDNTKHDRIKLLNSRLKNNSITFEELKELLRN